MMPRPESFAGGRKPAAQQSGFVGSFLRFWQVRTTTSRWNFGDALLIRFTDIVRSRLCRTRTVINSVSAGECLCLRLQACAENRSAGSATSSSNHSIACSPWITSQFNSLMPSLRGFRRVSFCRHSFASYHISLTARSMAIRIRQRPAITDCPHLGGHIQAWRAQATRHHPWPRHQSDPDIISDGHC